MSRFVRSTLVAILVLLAGSAVGHGAPRLSIGGMGGIGLPEKSLIDASEDLVIAGNDNPPTNFAYLKQRASVAFGVRASAWLTSRIGVEGEFVVLPSTGDFRAAFFDPDDNSVSFGVLSESAGSTHFGLLLNYAIVQPALDPLLIYLSAGIGATKRSGDVYDELLELKTDTDIGGVFGLGLRYGLSSSLALRADLRDYVTSYDPEVPDTGSFYSGQTQHDMILSAGIDFALVK